MPVNDFSVITSSVNHVEDGFFANQRYRRLTTSYFFMENSILKILGSMDVKITPDFCSNEIDLSVKSDQ